MRNEIRRDGQTLSIANWQTEIRAAPNLKISGKIFTNSISQDMGDWFEKIRPGAFQKSIKNRNIYLLWQHDHKSPLANTKSKTLRIREVNDGIEFDADLPDTQMGRDVHQLISTGVVTGTSFAMSEIIDSWVREGGKDVRYIESATLHELSPVTWPAYESSYVAARSKTEEFRDFFSDQRKEKMKRLEKEVDDFFRKDTKFKDITEFLRAIRAAEETAYMDPRLTRAAGLSVGNDGLVVDTDFSTKLISAPNAPEQWLRATLILLGKNTGSVKLPVFAKESRDSDSILGGVKFYYVEEADDISETQFKLRALSEGLKKTACLIYGTDELFEDSQLGSKVIPAAVQTAWNSMVIEGITDGSGAGRPLGILNAACTLTVAKETGQDSATVVAENIENMLKHLPPESWQSQGLCWQVHKDLIPQLSTMTKSVGTGGTRAAMWHWREGGEKFNKLCGIDVLVNPHCKALGQRGDIILSDMREYVICHKESKQSTSIHVRFIYSETAFKVVFRWDGQPSWSKAVTPAQGATKISPFITLGERS